MKAYFKFIVILCAVLLAGLNLARAGAEGGQPRMEAALQDLQDAKTSNEPGKLLHRAKGALERAAHNKHGWRLVSLAKLDQAIQAAETGDNQRMIEKIDATIADVHDAMAHAPGSR